MAQLFDFALHFDGFGFFLGLGAGADLGAPGRAPDLLLKGVLAFAEEDGFERKNLRQPFGASTEVDVEEEEEALVPLLQEATPLRSRRGLRAFVGFFLCTRAAPFGAAGCFFRLADKCVEEEWEEEYLFIVSLWACREWNGSVQSGDENGMKQSGTKKTTTDLK